MNSQQSSLKKKSAALFIVFQFSVIALYTIFPINFMPVSYFPPTNDKNINSQYIWVSITAVIGFGLITGVVKTMYFFSYAFIPLIYALTFELYFLFNGLFYQLAVGRRDQYAITGQTLINAGQAAIAMIICYGVVGGRINSFGIFYICVVGVAGYTYLKNFIYHALGAFDIAKGLLIHTYGSFYGLVVTYFVSKNAQVQKRTKKIKNQYFFQHIAALGFLFLFVLFPILNSVPDNQTMGSSCPNCLSRTKKNHQIQKIIIFYNTLFGLLGSVSAALLLTWTQKIKYNQIIYSGLTGGVISASIVNFIPYHIIFFVFGFFGAFITKISMQYVTPLIQKYGVEDGRWTLSMHGIPGVLSSLLSVLLSALQVYTNYDNYQEYLSIFPFPNQRFGSEQALYQFEALLFTLFMSLIGGFASGALITGFLPGIEKEGNDAEQFQVPDYQIHEPYPFSPPDDLQAELKMGIIH